MLLLDKEVDIRAETLACQKFAGHRSSTKCLLGLWQGARGKTDVCSYRYECLWAALDIRETDKYLVEDRTQRAFRPSTLASPEP